MILGITGHRDLGGKKVPNPIYNYVREEAKKQLIELKPEKIITGMAIGFDTIIAELCVGLKIPFVAAVPFKGQELWWPNYAQKKYFDLLDKADDIVYTSPPGYASWKMMIRNKYIVDGCELLLAAFNGENSGGTFNTISYAKEKNRHLIIINPNNAKK